MPRLAFKPDASFVRFIALGAVGSRAVAADLGRLGHDMQALENGSTDTKLWKDVKRKRVRIPDLVCTRCGLRVESRAKTSRKVAMSHSEREAERAWDYGMVGADVIAFPVVEENQAVSWSRNDLDGVTSSYIASEFIDWSVQDHIPYLTVAELRRVPPTASSQKGVTEGSETTIEWDVIYSSRLGEVEAVVDGRVSVRREADGHRYTWQNRKGLSVRVAPGERVRKGQILASELDPLSEPDLRCRADLEVGDIDDLLRSPERTQRFTGLKLARLRSEDEHVDRAEEIRRHPDEDLYVRLEAATYLVACRGADPTEVFQDFVADPDPQVQLEAILALAEAGSERAVAFLGETLLNDENQFFLRSAAAWGLGHIGSRTATQLLLQAFEIDDVDLREDALEAASAAAGAHSDLLIGEVSSPSDATAAGSAEALRRLGNLEGELIRQLRGSLEAAPMPVWQAWLLGALGSDAVGTSLDGMNESSPRAHFAIVMMQRFVESWIAERWLLRPSAASLKGGDQGQ